MSAPMQLTEWIDATASNYLEDFVPAGGAAVKFAVAMDGVSTTEITAAVTDRASELGFLTATIDAAQVKIGSIEQVLAAICDQIDLPSLIDQLTVNLLASEHWIAPVPGSAPLTDRIASANSVDGGMVLQTVRPILTERIYNDHEIAQDMRAAVISLVMRRLAGGESMITAFAAISDWLGGRTTKISSLRDYHIRSKVNRANGRFLFESLLHVVRLAGLPGLVVTVDISRFTATDKVPGRINYAKAGLLDGYEVLREFVDATDDLESFLMIVAAPLPFLDSNDRGRGIGRYPALLHRVYDDVRDRNLTNPLAALVRVGDPIPEVIS